MREHRFEDFYRRWSGGGDDRKLEVPVPEPTHFTAEQEIAFSALCKAAGCTGAEARILFDHFVNNRPFREIAITGGFTSLWSVQQMYERALAKVKYHKENV